MSAGEAINLIALPLTLKRSSCNPLPSVTPGGFFIMKSCRCVASLKQLPSYSIPFLIYLSFLAIITIVLIIRQDLRSSNPGPRGIFLAVNVEPCSHATCRF